MISTPEEMWTTSQSVYARCKSHEERVETNLEYIGGALLSIAQSLADINLESNRAAQLKCLEAFMQRPAEQKGDFRYRVRGWLRAQAGRLP